MPKPWPASPLAAAQRAFDLLTCPPVQIAFDGRGYSGLPKRIVALDELKKILVHESTPRPVRDRVWHELVIRARRDGPSWVVAVVGLAMPGLRKTAGMLAKGWHGDTRDQDAELLIGFLERLKTVDLDEPRICGRLIDAGARAVKQAREREEETDTILVDGAWSLPPKEPYDHPDWVLARAVAAAVIDPEEHLLISATRLEDVTLQVTADKLGVTVPVATAWRRKAELRLARAILDGELEPVSLTATAALRRAAAARAKAAACAAEPAAARATPCRPATTGARRRRPRRDEAAASAG